MTSGTPCSLPHLQLFAGKEQRRDLIGELRTTHALQSPEQKEKRREKEEVLSKQAHKSVTSVYTDLHIVPNTRSSITAI